MTTDLVLVLLLLGSAILMFALDKPRMDVVALLMIAALPLTGVITIAEALAGFSDPNIVLIALLFVLGEALVRTRVAQHLGDRLAHHAGDSETRLLVLLMLVVAGVGSVMSSTAVVAIFIPVALRIAGNAGLSPSRLMMPLSMAALLSGMLTLIATTPNLIVQGELVRRGFDGFAFFSFTPFGLVLLVAAILYMLVARRWLRTDSSRETVGRPGLAEWIEEYGLDQREHRLRVTAGSRAVGRTLADLDLRGTAGVNIIAIERVSRFSHELIQPRAATAIEADDVLLVDVSDPQMDLDAIRADMGLERLPLQSGYFSDRTQEIGMAEMIVPPTSRLVGSTIVQAGVRTEFDLTVLASKHGRTIGSGDVRDQILTAGDSLLVVGPWRAIAPHRHDFRDLIAFNVPREFDDVVPAPGKAVYAVAILGLTVAMMVLGFLPNVHVALIGCLLMGLFGCIDMGSAYRSIHWKSLVLIVGMLPFSLALQKTGGVDLAADMLLDVVGESGGRPSLAAIFVITSVLGLFVSNTGALALNRPP